MIARNPVLPSTKVDVLFPFCISVSLGTGEALCLAFREVGQLASQTYMHALQIAWAAFETQTVLLSTSSFKTLTSPTTLVVRFISGTVG